MKHTPLESQACQRQAIAFNKLDGRYRAVEFDRSLIYQTCCYCIDAPDLLTGETLYARGEGSFQWTVDRD